MIIIDTYNINIEMLPKMLDSETHLDVLFLKELRLVRGFADAYHVGHLSFFELLKRTTRIITDAPTGAPQSETVPVLEALRYH